MDQTPVKFGTTPMAVDESGKRRPRRCASVCPRCAQHFSPDGRFCPFDGEPLREAPEWDPELDPLLGGVVDQRYEIVSVLGEGGMGIVYEARHRALGKRFALKALRKDLASDPEIAARFMQEARTAAAVSHPGLVEIIDFGQLPGGQPFFVMELLEGQSLAELIRRGGAIPAARALEIVRQIAEALSAAHELSIVHRDLKPDNIHVGPGPMGRDRVTVVDFGLAKVIGVSRLTRAGTVFGTPHYMSPEQAMGEATDHRADVYALGIVMYEMFTGRVPFEADSYMGVLTKHMYMAPTPPSQLTGTNELGVLEAITLRCLEKKPEHRYPSLRELLHDLQFALNAETNLPSAIRQRHAPPRSLLADELEPPGRDEVPLRADRSRGEPWPRRLLLGIGLLFLLGIAFVMIWRTVVSSTGSAAPVAGAPPSAAQLTAVPRAAPPDASLPPTPFVVPPVPSVAAPGPALVESAPSGSGSTRPRVVAHSNGHGVRSGSAIGPHKKPTQLGSSEIVDPWEK